MSTVHPGFFLLLWVLLGSLSFIFQDPRVLLLCWLGDLLLITYLGWPRSMRKLYWLLGGLGALFTMLSWLLFVREGTAYWRGTIPLVSYPVQITDTGILWSIGMGLRIANVTLLSMYFFLTTTPRQLALALRGIGVPFSIGFLISLIFRFIPLVKNDLETIREAQLVRGLQLDRGRLQEKLRKYGFLLVPLIFTSLRRVQLIANALDAKGFQIRNRHHRFYQMPKWKKRELLLLCAAVCFLLALFYWARVSPAHYGVLLPNRI